MKQTCKQVVWPVLILLLFAGGGCSREEPAVVPAQVPSVEIPLNKIWAKMQPGARDLLRELDPDHFRSAVLGLELLDPYPSPLTEQISQAIYSRSEKKQPIGPGFAVAGTGLDALVAVKEIMEQDRMPSHSFPVGTEISIFFFTRDLGIGFGLKEIKQSSEAVAIRYRFVVGGTPNIRIHNMALTRYFYLIPLGKPTVGNIAVNMIEQPSKKDEEDARPFYKQLAEKQICKSFIFTIEPSGNEASVDH